METLRSKDGAPPRAADAAAPAGVLGLRPWALAEIAALLAALLALDALFFGGDRFLRVSPHPFWLVVLLAAVQYGVNEGLAAAFASSAALLAWNLPERPLPQDPYDYLLATSLTPILWTAAALVFGGLQTRRIRRAAALERDLRRARERGDALADGFERLKRINAGLETRVAGQLRTVTGSYQAAKGLLRLRRDDVIAGVPDVVRTVLNPRKFSLFLLKAGELRLAVNEGWDREAPYARSYMGGSPLYERVVGGKAAVCVADEDGERILAGEGALAGPLLDIETGEVLGMLKVESIDFLDLSLEAVDAFRILCDWLGVALGQARRYEKARRETYFASAGGLLSAHALRHQARFIAELGRRFGFPVAFVELETVNGASLSPEDRAAVGRAVAEAAEECLRKADAAFALHDSGESAMLVLAGAGPGILERLSLRLLPAVRRRAPARLAALEFKLHLTETERADV